MWKGRRLLMLDGVVVVLSVARLELLWKGGFHLRLGARGGACLTTGQFESAKPDKHIEHTGFGLSLEPITRVVPVKSSSRNSPSQC